MVITIEPGVYIDGLGGIRIEDTVLVTEHGCEVLTPTSKEFVELWNDHRRNQRAAADLQRERRRRAGSAARRESAPHRRAASTQEYVVSVTPAVCAAQPPLRQQSKRSERPLFQHALRNLTPIMLVKSPIVGTYYDAPSPGAPPFVKVGDAVEPGQVLCIIESMKLMNEIEAEIAGTIVAKLVENGRPVEYGEALFSIRPR